MYQRVGKAAYKADLSNTHKLAEYLDHPEKGLKSIHVAGTNGKGSTSHMLASVLQEAGYTVGLYTSPHLMDFRERIKINGTMIPKRFVSSFVTKHRPYFEANSFSFFEMTVGLAFDYFRRRKVDIAVIEVGLGGRLDSTNVVTPEVSVITNIGLDHTQFLGTTLPEIAGEKAGIIKPNLPVVIGESNAETKPVFNRFAEENAARITWAEEEAIETYPTDLLGDYQKVNQRTVLAVLRILEEADWSVSERHIRRGLQNVVKNTGLMGRWQILSESPKIICDTAHNREGLVSVMKQLSEETFNQLHIVLGAVSDKDLDRILPLFPIEATYYFCQPSVSRAMDAEVLSRKANEFGLAGMVFESVKSAFRAAQKSATKKDLIYIGGSTFVVAEVL